jgi:hypothetical protein
VLGVALILSTFWIAGFYLTPDPGNLFLDAHIYFRATAAWLDGANPWATAYREVPFAAYPPTLLLNVPLIPFGETAAVAFWVVANTLAVAIVIWRLHLPLWTVLIHPFVEGWLAASPDLTLAGLVLAGGGWLAAISKPYSAPAILAGRKWRQLLVAGAVGLATLPLLPWQMFYESRVEVAQAFASFAGRPVSAAGNLPLMALVATALVTLGWRRGWMLFTPGLLAQQPHYMVFSLEAVRWSRILALAMTIPLPHAAAVGVILFTVYEHLSNRGGGEAMPA